MSRRASSALGAFYAGMTRFGMSAFGSPSPPSGCWWRSRCGLIGRWHRRNCVQHREEVERLLAIARSDGH
jgi:LPLT family lysophospholipid transporter-like MFS transporter